MKLSPIGIFDSGYGGLTILKEIKKLLPQYDFIYLGDNARTPYGTRSFETVYHYTKECVQWLFEQNCNLVILACNTASAKALRSIQQKDLKNLGEEKKVLGVIRPTAETIGNFSQSKHIGILATKGTVQSQSYLLEVEKFFPEIQIFQQACPLWVPLIENDEFESAGADFFIKKYVDELMAQSPKIDAVLLACTHYPLILKKIQQHLPENVQIISQGEIVAHSLLDYLNRHNEMDSTLSKNGEIRFYTTDEAADFDKHSVNFYGKQIHSTQIAL